LLLSPSLFDLQLMIDICCAELERIDMCLNVKKSQVLRKVNSVVINGSPIEFVAEMKYLGWYIRSGNDFHMSLHYMRVHFYQCFNSL